MFQGWVERWPQQWEDDGTFSEVAPDIVDGFAVLSQTLLPAPFFKDVQGTNPRFFFPLNDPQHSTTCVDASSNYPPAQSVQSYFGASGTSDIKFGDSIQATSPPLVGGVQGYGGPVVTFGNASAGSGAYHTQAPGTFISLDLAGITGPIGGPYNSGANNGWTRMVAFRCPASPAFSTTVWAWSPASFTSPASQPTNNTGLCIGGADYGASQGHLFFMYGSSAAALDVGPVCDGNWHLVFLSYDAVTNTINIVLDNVIGGDFSPVDNVNWPLINADTLGATVFRGSGLVARLATNTQVGVIAEWPMALKNNTPWVNTVQQLYTCWRTAWDGDSTDQRYRRIIAWAGYYGQVNIQSGQTQRMGPATDIIPTNGAGGGLITSGIDALTALNNVVITENGNHFIDANGVLTFQARSMRTQPFQPVVTFGESTATGEVPYEDLKLDFDTTQVGNDIQITQFFTQQTFFSEGAGQNPVNNTSQRRFGTRTLQRTVNTDSQNEAIDAANYYLYRYNSADTRVSKIRVHVSALYKSVPNAWGLMLALDLGAPVRVMRRPPGFPVIAWNGFVEKIDWDMTPGAAYVEFQLSPADRYNTALFTDMRTTLSVQAIAGAASVALNALPDAATNSFGAYACSGLQLEFEPGTPQAETVTVSSVSATSVGYTSVVVSLSSALANTHAAGSVVCEALPAGATNPALWDPQALFVTSASNAPSY